jgi:hypothetical protein
MENQIGQHLVILVKVMYQPVFTTTGGNALTTSSLTNGNTAAVQYVSATE